MLLEHSADLNSKDEGGRTPLHGAIDGSRFKGDYPQIVRLLLEHGADKNARDTQHWTPLHNASMGLADLDTVRISLKHGADVDAKNKLGKTPLQVALKEALSELAQLLSEFRSGSAQT